MIAACLAATSCASRSDTSTPSATSTSAEPLQTVAVSALKDLLLDAEAINSIMGSSSMTESWSGSKLSDDTENTDAPDCIGAKTAGQKKDYEGHGWVAARGSRLEENDELRHYVSENVVSFNSAEDAKGFYDAQAQIWADCAGTLISFDDQNDRRRSYTLGEPNDADGFLTMSNYLEGGDGWGCQRVIMVENNVAADISACSYDIGDQGLDIAREIKGKVATE